MKRSPLPPDVSESLARAVDGADGVLDLEARARGQVVHADQYPYTAGSTVKSVASALAWMGVTWLVE